MRVFESVILSFAICATTASLAHADEAGGVISFSGKLVEAPCDVRQSGSGNRLDVNCMYRGKSVPQTLSLSRGQTDTLKSDNRFAMDVRYLNPEKTLAIVSMSYY